MKRSGPIARRTRMRRQSRKRPKIAALLALWSKVVRQRAGHRCESCGRTGRLEAHHVWPKGKYHAVRFFVPNGVSLCFLCHKGPEGVHANPMQWGGDNGIIAGILFARGTDLIGLRELAMTGPRPDLEAVRAELMQELES